MKKIFLTTLTIFSLFFCCQAAALQKNEFNNVHCHLTEDDLTNSDKVIQNLLEMATSEKSWSCPRTFIIDQADPKLGRFPVEAAKQFKDFEQGLYREYRIIHKQKGLPLDGYDTVIYTAELQYVYAKVRAGIISICEHAIVPIRLVRTPWGWYPRTQYYFGSRIWPYVLNNEKKDKVIMESRRMNKDSLTHCSRRFQIEEEVRN